MIALEPDRDNAGRLRQNIKANQLEAIVQIEEVAASNVEGTATLTTWNSMSTIGVPHNEDAPQRTHEIQTTTLRTLLQRHGIAQVDLLLVDVEGAELLGTTFDVAAVKPNGNIRAQGRRATSARWEQTLARLSGGSGTLLDAFIERANKDRAGVGDLCRELMEGSLIVIGEWADAEGNELRIQDFSLQGQPFIPVFSDQTQFWGQLGDTPYLNKGLEILCRSLVPRLKGDELLILNPGSTAPVHLCKNDFEPFLAAPAGDGVTAAE